MRLSFDHQGFAAAVKHALEKRSWSYAEAVRHAPFIDTRMISRAVNGQVQSVPVFMALCAAFDLDAFAFVTGWSHGNVVRIQPVTVGVSRETLSFAHRTLRGGYG